MFNRLFTGNATVEFDLSEGACVFEVTIVEANGNTKFKLSILTPEVRLVEFTEDEVP